MNYELAQGSTCEKVQFLRKLSKGTAPHKDYGIKLAKLSSLPQEVTDAAEELAKELREKCGYSSTAGLSPPQSYYHTLHDSPQSYYHTLLFVHAPPQSYYTCFSW